MIMGSSARTTQDTLFSIGSKTSRKKITITLADLKEEDKKLAREFWFEVEHNYITISKILFTKLFKKYPEYKRFFTELMKDNSTIDEDVWVNPLFERHMVQILMPALGRLMRNLDDEEAIVKQMTRLGQFHKENVKIKKRHVENLKRVFLTTLKDYFGPRFDPPHEAAMKKILDASLSIFQDQLI